MSNIFGGLDDTGLADSSILCGQTPAKQLAEDTHRQLRLKTADGAYFAGAALTIGSRRQYQNKVCLLEVTASSPYARYVAVTIHASVRMIKLKFRSSVTCIECGVTEKDIVNPLAALSQIQVEKRTALAIATEHKL